MRMVEFGSFADSCFNREKIVDTDGVDKTYQLFVDCHMGCSVFLQGQLGSSGM